MKSVLRGRKTIGRKKGSVQFPLMALTPVLFTAFSKFFVITMKTGKYTGVTFLILCQFLLGQFPEFL